MISISLRLTIWVELLFYTLNDECAILNNTNNVQSISHMHRYAVITVRHGSPSRVICFHQSESSEIALKGDSPLSQRSAIANGRYCHVMYKLLYPSIRVRTAPPVSVRVRTRVSVSFSFTVLRTFAIADLNPLKTGTISFICFLIP